MFKLVEVNKSVQSCVQCKHFIEPTVNMSIVQENHVEPARCKLFKEVHQVMGTEVFASCEKVIKGNLSNKKDCDRFEGQE